MNNRLGDIADSDRARVKKGYCCGWVKKYSTIYVAFEHWLSVLVGPFSFDSSGKRSGIILCKDTTVRPVDLLNHLPLRVWSTKNNPLLQLVPYKSPSLCDLVSSYSWIA